MNPLQNSKEDPVSKLSLADTRPVGDRVVSATMELLLLRGTRKLRTADIAEYADTTESTVFRYFKNLDAILAATYQRAWRGVNEVVSDAAFGRPFSADPQQALLGDMAALWSMKDDPEQARAATVAFLFLRRRGEILGSSSEAADEEIRFQRRLDQLCSSIVKAEAPSDEETEARQSTLLATLIMNYSASVWMTWFCMPFGSEEVTDWQHDLSADEAQLGVLILIDRSLKREIGEPFQSANGGNG